MKATIVSGLRPTTEVGTNPKDAYGDAKVPLTLIPETAIVLCAIAMRNGARKYGAYNWRGTKVQSRIYIEAARRHLAAVLDGEDFDSATGIPHIAFVMATAAIYIDAWVSGQLIDNRPLPGKAGDLIELLNESPGITLTPSEIRSKIEHFVASSSASTPQEPKSQQGNKDYAY